MNCRGVSLKIEGTSNRHAAILDLSRETKLDLIYTQYFFDNLAIPKLAYKPSMIGQGSLCEWNVEAHIEAWGVFRLNLHYLIFFEKNMRYEREDDRNNTTYGLGPYVFFKPK